MMTKSFSLAQPPRPILLATFCCLISMLYSLETPVANSICADLPPGAPCNTTNGVEMINDHDDVETIDYGNHNQNWEDGPTSWEEFGHDNDPSICGVPRITVQEWEEGKYWEGKHPVIVLNVTNGWAALNNWKKQEIVRLYPDAEATMGEAKLVGETGPDDAGKNLKPTTVKEFITKHMYNPTRYFFDRKIAIPKGMLEDCHPFPMPTRAYLNDPTAGATFAPSKKKRVIKKPDRELWRDHLAISIGSDLNGLTFHHHREAWNIVIFGKKRWILWDHSRWKGNNTRQWKLTRDYVREEHITGAEWIRRLYPEPDRTYEIRNYGHDCIQHAGEMMFVPHRYMHMVVNIGDTVSVISEVGLGIGEGKKTEDFLKDPDERYISSSSDDEWSTSSDDFDDGPPPNDFIIMDTNQDGRVSMPEAKRFFDDRRHLYDVNLADLWEMDDTDGDGYISWEEFSGPKGAIGELDSEDF